LTLKKEKRKDEMDIEIAHSYIKRLWVVFYTLH